MMKSNGKVFALFVIMTFGVTLSKGDNDDPSSEDAAEKDEMQGPVDNFCFVCEARGRRRRTRSKVLQNCLHVSTSDDVQKVMCQHGCMAAYGVFRNNDESIERLCVGGSQMEQELVDLYAVVKTKRLVEKKDGSMYSCDKVYFDYGDKDDKAKLNTSSDTISRDPVSYSFCWCRGNECNGRQINGFIGARASGRMGGGRERGRILMTFVIAMIFGAVWIPGSLGDKIKCSSCTEKTHSDCFEGGKDINIRDCDPVLQYTNSCIKMQTCVSGLPCEIYRGCKYKTIDYCLKISDVVVTDHECNKRKFKLNTPWGSTTIICLHSLKTFFEKKVWKGNILKPSSDFDDEDELKATKADGAIVEVEYCHCNTDNCNGGLGINGSLGMVLGLVGCLAFMSGGRGRGGTLMTVLITLGVLTMVTGQVQSNNGTNLNSTTSGANESNITFDCFKCSDSKTSCYYSYLDECPSIDISNKDTLKDTKYQEKSCKTGNDTRLCKTLTTQHILGGGPKETEKGCLDPKELDCFQEIFQLNVPEGGCAEKSMGYEEYTKWLRCNVKNKVKIMTNYNEGVVNIMEEMKDFYGEEKEEQEEFKVRFCTCNAEAETSKGCNYNLN